MLTPVLHTERLTLRPLSMKDSYAIHNCWMKDPEVSKYMFWEATDSIQDVEAFIEYELTMLHDSQWFRWLIEGKENGELYGTCLLFYNEDEKNFDISYNLGRAFWGNGYTTEAMRAVISFAVNTLHVKEIVTSHALLNTKSGRVLQKLGFIYEKNVDFPCGIEGMTGKWYRLSDVSQYIGELNL